MVRRLAAKGGSEWAYGLVALPQDRARVTLAALKARRLDPAARRLVGHWRQAYEPLFRRFDRVIEERGFEPYEGEELLCWVALPFTGGGLSPFVRREWTTLQAREQGRYVRAALSAAELLMRRKPAAVRIVEAGRELDKQYLWQGLQRLLFPTPLERGSELLESMQRDFGSAFNQLRAALKSLEDTSGVGE